MNAFGPSFDRRSVLLGGAAVLSGCATRSAAVIAPETDADSAEAELRTLVDRLADRPRTSRPFLLRQFNARRLTPTGRILYDALLPGADADAALSRFAYGQSGQPYAVTHRNGTYRRAAELRAEDDKAFLAREIQRESNRLEGDAGRGVIAPDFVIDATLPLVDAATERTRGAGDAWAPVTEALAQQASALRALRPRAGSEAGVWRLPNGEEYYAQALQFQYGDAIDARDAHTRALTRCRELQSEADALLRRQQLTSGDVAARLRALLRDPRYLASDDAAKAAAVAAMTERLDATRALMDGVVDNFDASAATAGRLDPRLERNGTQGRRVGAAYEVDLGAPRPTWTLASVVHHEVYPGHILQAPYERFIAAPALQTLYSGGYGEGWAIYAEQLADEHGAFADDPLGRLGYLHWMLFRMARVVVDTGIHVMRWNRQRAIDEMRALQGDSIAFVSIEDDVTRFCVQPGAFAAQGLAALQMAELRDQMQRSARGFTLTRFHDAMLRAGSLSPPGLAQAARAAFSV